jgi:hypothetical protein
MRLSPVLTALCLTAGLFLATPAPSLRAADPAAEIELQRSLDAPIESLELSNIELPKVFDDLAAKGKIKLQVDPTCYDLLPYGNTTKVSATFRQSKLRDAIDEILKHVGLEKTVSGDKVLILPTAPLLRIGRRATWDELNILATARVEQLPALTNGNLLQGLRTVLSMDTLQLRDALPAGPEHDAAIEQVRKQLPTEAWKALDIYAQSTGQIWFVSENTIEVMTQRQWIQRQLDRRIEIKKTNRPLVECVSELAHLSGIHFTPDPGLYALYPQVTLNSTGGTVREILDTLRGVIGINYEIRDDSILLKKMTTDTTPAAARTDPILGQIAIPLSGGGEINVFFRESQLPPEVADAIKKQVADSIEKIRKSVNTPAGGAVTTTRTTTAPAKGTE